MIHEMNANDVNHLLLRQMIYRSALMMTFVLMGLTFYGFAVLNPNRWLFNTLVGAVWMVVAAYHITRMHKLAHMMMSAKAKAPVE